MSQIDNIDWVISNKDMKCLYLEWSRTEEAVVFCHGGTIRAAHVVIKGLDGKDFIALDTPPLSMHVYKLGKD